MKTCTIFWKGQSKSGKYYLGVNYEENGFLCKSFVGVSEAKFDELPEEGEIEIPEKALS